MPIKGSWTVYLFKGGKGFELGKKEGELFLRRFDTLRTLSIHNNLKVTTNYYEKKFLLVMTKNKRNSSKPLVPITYRLEKGIFAAGIF